VKTEKDVKVRVEKAATTFGRFIWRNNTHKHENFAVTPCNQDASVHETW